MDSYLTLSRVSEGSPVLQFSIFASLVFKLPSVIFFCCCWIVLLIECLLFLLACCRTFIFFFFQFVSFLCYLYPSMVVFYVTAVRCFCYLWFEKVAYFVFPSFPQSTPCSACLDFGTKSWVPSSSFPYPSFFWWRCYSHRQSPFHSSVHFDRTRNLGPSHSISLSESSAKETSLSWSQSVSVLLPSCVSLSEFSSLFFSFSMSLVWYSCGLPFSFWYFLFVRWVEASSVLLLVSIFRVRLSRSMFHTRSPM